MVVKKKNNPQETNSRPGKKIKEPTQLLRVILKDEILAENEREKLDILSTRFCSLQIYKYSRDI